MPRKRDERTQLTVYLPVDLAVRLTGRAQSLGMSASAHLKQLAEADLACRAAPAGPCAAEAMFAGCPGFVPYVVEALRLLVQRQAGDWPHLLASVDRSMAARAAPVAPDDAPPPATPPTSSPAWEAPPP